MNTGEGLIEIDLHEFWGFVDKYFALDGAEIAYGVPRVNKANKTIEIDYAFGTDNHPGQWKETPDALKQWEQKD